MHENPLYWRRVMERLSRPEPWAVRPAGVPVLGDPCPTEVRVPLRAVLRQAFLAGNREAPLVDALADVAGWETGDEGKGRDGRVQIVVPVRGAHDALRLCVACIAAHTRGEYRMTLATSQDEGPALRDLAHEEMRNRDEATALAHWTHDVFTRPTPQSFAANCNLGASRCRSEFIVLLNSDAFVGPQWLDALLAPFSDPEVVAVGPMGTSVSGHQLVDRIAGPAQSATFPPTTASEVAQRVESYRLGREQFRISDAEPYPARRLVGFCLAVRRSAWDRVGGLDEALVNSHEDDELCLKLSLVGKLVVVPDLLVLHAGSASFAELPDAEAGYKRTLVENARRLDSKWGWIRADLRAWLDSRGWR